MGLTTWKYKIAGKEIGIKMLKDDAKHFVYHTIRLVSNVAQYKTEIWGGMKDDQGNDVGTEKPHRSTMMNMFGQAWTPSEEIAVERLKLLEELPALIDSTNAPEIKTKYEEFFHRVVPVVDKRPTVAEAEEATRVRREADDKHRREEEEKAETHMKIPEGMMGISLVVVSNRSDMRSDYFHDHATEDEQIVALVPRQAETQSLARSIISKCPELAGVEFEWRTEKYSMGHGNYLNQTGGPKPTIEGCEYPTRFEIQFEHSRSTWIRPHANFSEAGESPAIAGAGVSVARNEAHNGIEVRFPARPDDSVIVALKSQSFRWSGRQRLWYTKYTPSKWDFAQKLAGSSESEPAMPELQTEQERELEHELQQESGREAY